jgi:hypothetical protein
LLAKPLKSGPTVDVVPAVPPLHNLTRPLTAVVSAVTDSADAVIGEASKVVSTVTRTAAPVPSEVDTVVGTVDDTLASVDPSLPRIPVPGVKIPEVPVPSVDVPAVPKPLPSEPRPAPAPDAERPVAAVPSPANAESKAPAASVVAAPSTTARASVAKTAPAPAGADVAYFNSRGKTLAQLVMTSSGRPLAAVTLHARPLVYAPLGLEHVHPAATQGESGPSSSGSDGSGGQAADVTGAWNGLTQNFGARVHDAAAALPPSPAFDPGSSPD